jgi:hypothetical protein
MERAHDGFTPSFAHSSGCRRSFADEIPVAVHQSGTRLEGFGGF